MRLIANKIGYLAVILGLATSPAALAAGFTLTTTIGPEQGKIPALYTCDGNNVSPPLAWSGAPHGTQTFALVIADPDAPSGTFYHWVLYNIPLTATGLPEDVSAFPSGTLVGSNSSGKANYYGPCPPKGLHHYIFTLYAVDTALPLPAGIDAGTLEGTLENHVLQRATYMMVYKRS